MAGLAAVAAAAGAITAPPASGGITPELREAMGRALPIERIRVVATMAQQADPPAGADPPAIIGALRNTQLLTQPGLLTRLGLSGPVRSYWLVNAFSVRAIPLEIGLIAADPAVATVDLDPSVGLRADPPPARLQQVASRNWGLEAIRAPEAWSETGGTGAGVRIGSIDTGVDAGHPALAGKVVAWRDAVAGRPAPYDDHGHGTHTAGTLAGGDAGADALGVAPGAKLLVAKAIPGNGLGSGSDIISAAQWLADPDGDPATSDFPSVISNSWGEAADANDPWFRPLLQRWRSLGIVAVFAAGNTGPRPGSVGSPSGYPEALAVGAVDQARRVADFSSRGPVQWQNRDGTGPAAGPIPKPDLAGPGVAIVSSTGGGYAAFSGTSMASPHVAGVAALMRAANPTLSVAQVEATLRQTAADIAAPGRDNDSGHGLVDALAAVRRAAASPGAVQPARRVARASRARGPRGKVKLTVEQLRINRRIALTAERRVGILESRLAMPPSEPSPVTAAARRRITRLSASQMRLTQRISQSALRRATAVQRHVAERAATPPVTPLGKPAARVGLSVRQLIINQRIAQAALRRVKQTEETAGATGMLPPA